MNYERILRRVRAHPALWGELGQVKETQAFRLRDKCKAKLTPMWDERAAEVQHQRGQRLLQTWA